MRIIEIAGVEFCFQRKENVRGTGRHWSVTAKKTGIELFCFTGKTLREKVNSIQHTAQLCGERFKTEMEAA